ncbi:MAG: hypothetical protein B7X86_01170 [Sphingobacteriales bacterium 17-39-43]|uniref:DUF3078 domain-containing protein n=1 Tax=Daejeonella sp. TaxID=2805397 RepID=UPI000BCBDCF3|nr:DUF3078 domain-containing protein [Daejeonella sp.]OYZ32977.1 MAG: hypothetical protein B7Y24_01175 [Sphingobacteriales bacterium 16-39-50]OZA26387.1 MAG: hypothetical protein B7X86_01170 [Sphingobacteriales bacterium 17-39-43]HQT21518.1 DUF3078 domain-containing protein [Daejeonella sp.]HQT56249.1 DUF3078 domain-containing protein [Daejeonella sp.]
MRILANYFCEIKISLILLISLQLFVSQTEAIGQTPLADTSSKNTDTVSIKKDAPWQNHLMMSVGLGGLAVFNWSNGSTPNHNFNTNIRLNSTYNNKKRIQITSQTMFALGYNSGADKVWKKNTDLFYSDNIFLYSLNKKTKYWYLAGIADLSTQIFDGYMYDDKTAGVKHKVSSFLSPGFLTEGVGMLYMNKIFYFGVAPTALNHMFVIDKDVKASLHSIEVDRFTSDFGFLLKTGYYHYLLNKKVYVKVLSTYFKDYHSDGILWTSNGLLRVNFTKWLSFNSDYSLLYNNKQNSLDLVSANTSGIPTGITKGSSKVQTFITYGLGVNLKF